MSHESESEHLWSLIKEARVAMLTSDDGGTLRSRPMVAAQKTFDGTLWFFTRASAPKASEVNADSAVNVSYASPDENTYVSLSGNASVVRDNAAIAEHWNKGAEAWFPKGKDDPDVALLRVDVTQAEYWDAPSSKMVVGLAYLKSKVTGKPPGDIGDHGKVRL
jgi:general stress protein 26